MVYATEEVGLYTHTFIHTLEVALCNAKNGKWGKPVV